MFDSHAVNHRVKYSIKKNTNDKKKKKLLLLNRGD